MVLAPRSDSPLSMLVWIDFVISRDVDAFVLEERAVFGGEHRAAQVQSRCASTAPSAAYASPACRQRAASRSRNSMNAVVFGLVVASGRTSGSVRYT